MNQTITKQCNHCRTEYGEEMTCPNCGQSEFTLNYSEIEKPDVKFWGDAGSAMTTGVIGFDTETELIKGNSVPQLSLGTCCDGNDNVYIIEPERMANFVVQNAHLYWAAHNWAFDFWVVEQHLQLHAPQVLPIWWTMANQNRFIDTMIYDGLVRVAMYDDDPINRNIGDCCERYKTTIVPDKNDPFRRRYGELINKDLRNDEIDPGFFTYALDDARAEIRLFHDIHEQAAWIVNKHRDFGPQWFKDKFKDSWYDKEVGPLTVLLQTKASIIFERMTKLGLKVDQNQVKGAKKAIQANIQENLDALVDLIPESGDVFKRNKEGKLSITASGAPSMSKDKLASTLVSIAQREGINYPVTEKTKKPSTSVKFWGQYRDKDPFIDYWIGLQDACKLAQFFTKVETDRLHPRYRTIVRTGRTSAFDPNIHQLPRYGGFREMIVPDTGYVFLNIDYSAIELVTLAATCLHRYGESELAEVLKQEIDPHAYTAAMFAGLSTKELQERDDYKTLRQQAKAINFGVPGGLGVRNLTVYAKQTYGVDLSQEEARKFRNKLIYDVYPELARYLNENLINILYYNCWSKDYGNLIHDEMTRYADTSEEDRGLATFEFKRKYRNEVLNLTDDPSQTVKRLRMLETVRNPRIVSAVNSRDYEKLCKALFYYPAYTWTGRIRDNVAYTQQRNTPFQGLAADGAKAALWRLWCENYWVCAFVHDEFLIQIPEASDYTKHAQRVEEIICSEMAKIVDAPEIPVKAEYSISRCWSKDAEAVWDNGELKVWEKA